MNRSEEEEELMEDVLQGTMNPPAAGGIVPGGGVATATALASEAAAPSSRSRNKNNDVLPAAAENIDSSLPMEETQTLLGLRHRQYKGFWLPEFILTLHAHTARACFDPDPSDIFLASLLKSGTTWLKALAFATLHRATHSPSDTQHPLRHRNPHDCVPFLEFMTIQIQDDDDAVAAATSTPRLLYTHMPYSQLPRGITEKGCKIVYVCRDPKDVLVSYWNFSNKTAATLAAATDAGDGDRVREQAESDAQAAGGGLLIMSSSFQETFEHFCEGRFSGGPHWLHVLEYWHESQRRPSEVLFLRYEDVLGDPAGNLKKLAVFMGCAFSEEEQQAGGVVDQIVELCSLGSLKSLDVNKNGTTVMGVKNESFFRKGQVGDWKNFMTMDMAARLDKIVEDATRGSGLTFGG